MSPNPFKSIVKIFKDIGKIFVQLGSIKDFLSCPVKLFTNFDKCAWFFFMDTLMLFIHFIVKYFICLVYIFIPFYIIITILNFVIKYVMGINYEIPITLDMCSPKKDTLCWGIEFMNELVGRKIQFINRSRKDLSTCYCVKPLRNLFQPYTSYKTLEDIFSVFGGFDIQWIVLIIIIVIILIGNIVRLSTRSSGGVI